MATDSEIIGAFAANAADIVRLEAALAAKDAEIERWKAVANDLSLDRNRVGLRAEAAEAEVARLKIVARDYVGGWREREKAAIATERERAARVVLTFGYSERLENIAAAIRAG